MQDNIDNKSYLLEGNCQYQIVCFTKKAEKTISKQDKNLILLKFNTFVHDEPLVIVYDVQITPNYIYIDMKADPSVNMHAFVGSLKKSIKTENVTWDKQYYISTVPIKNTDIMKFMKRLETPNLNKKI